MAAAAINIKIPEISITIEDLAALTTIQNSNEGGTYCAIKSKVENRLIFLGLVMHGVIPPCPKQVKEFEDNIPKLIERAEKALKKRDWRELDHVASELRSDRKPESRKGLILTDAGKALLKTGRTESRTVKGKGCL
jgi:hypothetical protein